MAPDISLLPNKIFESFKKICLGLFGYQVFVFEFSASAVYQIYKLGFEKICINAKPLYFPYKFWDFANLLISDFATKFSMWLAVTGLVCPYLPFKLARFSGLSTYQVWLTPPKHFFITYKSPTTVSRSIRLGLHIEFC